MKKAGQQRRISIMKNFRLYVGLLLAALLPGSARANLTGPYTADANTLALLHMDSGTGGSTVLNLGTLGDGTIVTLTVPIP
jgi:hypothetical protein